MGAETFMTTYRAMTADDAFRAAVDDATYEHGHGPYTGTISEKVEFTTFAVPTGMTAAQFVTAIADHWLEPDESQLTDEQRTAIEHAANVYTDKWGPAVCVEVPGSESPDGMREFIFCGLASS